MKITLIPTMGMIFKMLIHIAWLLIPTKVAKSLGMSTSMSLDMTHFSALAIVLSVSSVMAY